ncbi:hypothetical protein [Janthinobacterium agaricidamnosum]|uniref:Uncharacterized protein n=1 Tax=Janthinobacterium agaricidamnosum NBRC 102515 = DSM 9628 TaxID=1349767 RepID=W0V1N6_9BURK|nr:hypothetical protein [Janthinobacterium agaricidamnosum]CDG82739.1 hypothetical protein GJA_2104 [Janthinobacterium agaricidamnosum NBRC 102515 = DSM 9628]
MNSLKKKTSAARPQASWLGELGLIRRPLLCCALAVPGAIAAIGVSNHYLHQQDDRLKQAQQARNAASERFNHVENEKQDIRTFQPAYVALQQKNLLGAENRLDWIEVIHRSQQQRKLLPITYDIDAQQVFKTDARVAMGPYQLRGSKMELHMDLLHEMDLFHFLDDLRQRNYFAVQQCTIKRNSAVEQTALAPHLSADCTLVWLTLEQQGAAP